MQKIPRIVCVGIMDAQHAPGGRVIVVGWAGKPARSSEIDLSGWIATGGSVLAPLRDDELFAQAQVSDFGDAVFWGDPDGDLAIDAAHLEMLAEQQVPMSSDELSAWQMAARLSNSEVSRFLGIVPSTWARYKAGADIPPAMEIAIRAAKRDPIILQARLRPVRQGRPRKPTSRGLGGDM